VSGRDGIIGKMHTDLARDLIVVPSHQRCYKAAVCCEPDTDGSGSNDNPK
jgi:hypothetical protein